MVSVGTSNGRFTVRSAYYLEKERLAQSNGESMQALAHQCFWRKIWRLAVLEAIKLFLWRICNNLLPTRETLFNWRIVPTPLCSICELEVETVSHILWRCRSTKDVWTCSRIQKFSCEDDDFIYLLEGFMSKVNGEELDLVATVVRQIWLRRNKHVFGGDFIHPAQLVRILKKSLEEYLKT